MLDALFIGLVVLDGFLTQKLLFLGAVEANPNPFVLWSVDHLWVRFVAAVVIVLLLRRFGKWKVLEVLCFICGGICIYNAIMLTVGTAAVITQAVFG